MVVAPAGYGKTTALVQWARRAAVDVAWYRVDPSDADDVVLIRRLAAAVEVGTGVAVPATDLDSLIQVMETRGSPLVLVMDDLHLGGRQAERLVHELLLAAPPNLHILLGSRRLPTLNLARSELTGFLVTGEQLRFHPEEVNALFRDVYAAPLTAEEAALLTRRTGGWAAALHLFHLSMTDAPSAVRRRAIRGPAAAHYARDYLCWEVLDGLPDELSRFVRDTCVFEVVTAARCDRLLGRRGSQRLLEELDRWQALTSSTDGGQTFRYHEVMRTHLAGELHDVLGDEQFLEWRHKAALVLEAEGAVGEATRAHALNGDWLSVQRLVHEHGGEPPGAARTSWVLSVPSTLIEAEPPLALAQARAALDDGRLAEAVVIAQRVSAGPGPPDVAAEASGMVARLRIWIDPAGAARRDESAWPVLLRQALVQDPTAVAGRAAHSDETWAPFVEGVALLLAGSADAATRRFESVRASTEDVRLSLAVRLVGAAMSADSEAAALQVAEDAAAEELPWLSRLARAVAEAEREATVGTEAGPSAEQQCEEAGDLWGATFARGLRCVGQFRRGRADFETLERLAAELRRLGAPVLEAWARAALAHVAAEQGLPDAEREATSAEAFARQAEVPGALAIAYAALGRCGLERQADMFATADRWADEAGMAFRPWACAEAPAASGREPQVGGPTHGALSLRCFGRFEIHVDGRAPDLTRVRPRARALLRLLAVHAGRPVHREFLIDALWRELDLEAGTHNLHVSVSSLRRALEPGVARGASRLLVRDGERYVLRLPPGSRSDLLSFDQALTEGDLARSAGRLDDAVALLTEALALYRGDVLPEDGPEDWAIGPREHYRARAAETAATLAEIHLARQDPATAAAAALQSIEIDPCRDVSWRLLVSAYQSAGDLAAAERARRSYADVLASLGVVSETASSMLPTQRS